MKKKFGVGSLSILLFIFAMIWASEISYLNNFCLGDKVLEFVNLPPWSINPNGTLGMHYTVYYSFAILVVAIIVGHKFPEHKLSKLGEILSSIFAILFVVTCFLSAMTVTA